MNEDNQQRSVSKRKTRSQMNDGNPAAKKKQKIGDEEDTKVSKRKTRSQMDDGNPAAKKKQKTEDKENESDEHLSNKRKRTSRFPSLKEADLAGGCDDEKPAAEKKQKTEDKAYEPLLVDDPLKEFNSGSDVPKKSRKKKGKRGKGGKGRHPNMTTEKLCERGQEQYKQAKAGEKGCGALARNDKTIITKGGGFKFLAYTAAFVLLPFVNGVAVRATPGSERYEKIAITSGAVPQKESNADGSVTFTALKIDRTPKNAAEGHVTTFSKFCGFKNATGSGKTSPAEMLYELRRDTSKGNGQPGVHLYSENPKPQRGAAARSTAGTSEHYTNKSHIIFMEDFNRETVPPFFPRCNRTLTSVLKLNKKYNLAYIKTLEKKVTKPRVILALLLEHFGVDDYNNHKSEMNIETLGRIMKEYEEAA